MIEYYGNTITWVPQLKPSKLALYKQVANCIENDILSGNLTAGFQLPSQRIIAHYLKINHSTITRAYKLCEEKGLIKGITGKGTFVSSTAGIPEDVLSEHRTDLIDMGQTLPLYEMNPIIESHLKKILPLIDYDLILRYAPPEGHAKHRYIAAEWLNKIGFHSNLDTLLITAGTQNALSVILAATFKKGDRLLVDQFTYTGLKGLAKLFGIILVPVSGDLTGINIEDLVRCCRRENPKGIYLIPDYHNPTSVTLSFQKRREISQIIKKYDLLLIEDGAFTFCVDEKFSAISTLVPENAFYIYGTSKSLTPGLRISFLLAPKPYFNKLKLTLNHLTWMASPYTAEILTLLIKTSAYESILKEKQNRLKDRNALFDTMMQAYSFSPSTYGLFRYISLPKSWNDIAIERRCLEKGLQVFASKRFAVSANSVHSGLRISICAPKTWTELKNGLLILLEVLDTYAVDSELLV
ncbi:PLP-dependent aminotransferase family protein [Gottschalkiaceae bacterium SANA]|nr:PLP-dependent aminotransferase family protein [Gottschalkiaceae bacterium SANA]